MAIRDRVIDGLRAVFGTDRDERAKADSPSANAMQQMTPSMFSVWGREDIGGLLTVSQSLLDRFADYEAMEEYPDINCIAEGMRIYACEGGQIAPIPIEQLAMGGPWRQILAYDVKKQKLVKVDAQHARMTGREEAVIEFPLSNGSKIRCTPEHKILLVDRGYVAASELKKDDEVISAWAGFNPGSTHMMTQPRPGRLKVLEDPKDSGKARVFDVTTSTHNFLCEGAVVHNSAYHFYANDATQPSIKEGKTVWVSSNDRALQGLGNDFLHKRMRVEDDIWSQAYTLVMYGNNYEEVLVTDKGVIGLNHLPTPTMRRVERLDGALVGYVQDVTGQFTANSHELRKMLAGQTEIPRSLALFEDWQCAHFRLRATRRRSPYGVSVAEGARWIWKRLTMLEDAVMIYKLTRAPARYAYYVDVTDVPSDRVEGFLRKTKRDLKKKSMVDPRTGRMTMRHNPAAHSDDYFIAVREGRELARVEVLSGPDYQAVDDVEYFKRMMHGALRVPREYLGQEASIPSKSILSNEDVRAARVTMNIQRELRNGWERIIRTHLAALGTANPWAPEFEVEMTLPSGIWELAAYEVMNARADYASRVQPWVSTRWIQENILKIDEAEIKVISTERKKDAGAEQGGDLPSYAMGGGGGGAPPGPPEPGEEEPPSDAELEQGAPEPPRTNDFAWRSYDYQRRLEEWRYKTSNKRHDEVMTGIGKLMESDTGWARRRTESAMFVNELRKTGMRRTANGPQGLPEGNGTNRVPMNGAGPRR
jgi:hypothetical protein